MHFNGVSQAWRWPWSPAPLTRPPPAWPRTVPLRRKPDELTGAEGAGQGGVGFDVVGSRQEELYHTGARRACTKHV